MINTNVERIVVLKENYEITKEYMYYILTKMVVRLLSL